VFYVLAKVLWALLQPSSLMVAAVIAGAVLLATRWRRLARTLLWGGIAALLVGGLSPLGDLMIRPLEHRFGAADLERGGPAIAGIIVLGGGADLQAPGSAQIAGLNEAAERYTEAVALARRLPMARLVFSGGSGGLLTADPPEAETAGRLFEALGVAKDRITLEAASRDTWENALYTARLLQPKAGQRWLLVTSAWHMPRAIGCFRKAGFAVEPWPVDYRTPRRLDLARLNASIPEGLRRIDFVAKEYVGLLAYYLAGRTDALLPGPQDGPRPTGPGA
jgi:uncharacterized SAM-binding protein YcdF (DUF218 family)